jgi:hypothetical protein
MKIESHQIDRIEDGTIHFFVERKIYVGIADHLRRKGFSVGGRETTGEDGQSMVIITCTLEALNHALEDFGKAPMKTIQENGLNAVQLALQHSDPFLSAQLLQIVGNGTFTEPPAGMGKSVYRIFTPASPIPADFGKAVLDTLETFSKTPTGETARFDHMNIHGAIMFWRNFIA